MRLGPRPPAGLRGRLILLLVGALLVAQAATLALFLDERGRAVRVATAEEAAYRAAALAAEIAPLPPRAREAALREARSRWMRFRIDDEPWVDVAEARRLAPLAARVAEAAESDGRPLRVALRDRDDRERDEDDEEDGRARPGGHELVISAALDDRLWLNARAGLRPPPLQWAWPALTSLALAAVAVAAAVWISLGRMLRPMEALAEAADRLGRGEKPEPLPLRGPAEARRLADSFNRMADRLTRLLDDRARTLAAIGHDLRSPVTAMRLRVEMVDDDETRERLTLCLDEIQTLTEAALALARGAGAEEARRPVELRELLSGLVADLTESGARASLAAEAPVRVEARPAALKRALRNIAENAARYGGEARIRLSREGAGARIEIEDDGPGVPVEERERVFEPFVRLEASRSRETGGAGLGLAIARAVVEGHGGRVWLEDAPGGRTRAAVVLPAA